MIARLYDKNIFQFSSVSQSYLTLCNTMECSTPGLPVHHQFPESTQTHIHWVSDAIQQSYLLSSPSPPTFNLSQDQGLFQWDSSSHQVAKILEFQLPHQSFQWTTCPSVCKNQLMCSPTCISSQVPAPVPVTHFLMCWGPGMVLSPPRICCDSVGSTFSRALSCPSLPGSCFPLSESGICF